MPFMEERLRKAAIRQLRTESADRRVIRRVVLKPQSHETAERNTVVERLLHQGVREGVPLLPAAGIFTIVNGG